MWIEETEQRLPADIVFRWLKPSVASNPDYAAGELDDKALAGEVAYDD